MRLDRPALTLSLLLSACGESGRGPTESRADARTDARPVADASERDGAQPDAAARPDTAAGPDAAERPDAATPDGRLVDALPADSAASPPDVPALDAAAPDAAPAENLVINELMLTNTETLASPGGQFTGWLELYNAGGSAVDLGALRLGFAEAAGDWRLPAVSVRPGQYAVIHADETLGPAGESTWPTPPEVAEVMLRRGDAQLAAFSVPPDAWRPDVSVGTPLASFTPPVLVLDAPTPGRRNTDGHPTFQPRPPTFSVPRGHVDALFELSLSAHGGEVYVTTDGTPPTVEPALRFAGPIAIAHSTTVRALAVYPDLAVTTPEVAHTYIFLDEAIAAPTMRPRITQDPVYGPMMRASLQAQPSIFLTAPEALTAETKVPVAVEFYDPTGAEAGFSITAGAKLVGAHSLYAYPKNNMRLFFQAEFGPTKLRYPLYAACCTTAEHTPAEAFDELTLRSGAHDSIFYLGARQQPFGNGQYIRNRFMQETQRRMGAMSTDGRFVQVFLNREYFGHYDLQEQPDASFLAAYLGRDKDDYGAINAAVDGDLDVWAMVKASTADWAAASAFIDIDDLIDFQLLHYVAGNDWDWHTHQNWRAAGPRVAPVPAAEGAVQEPGWRFFAWDSDITFLDPFVDITNPNGLSRTGNPINPPDGVFTDLRAHPEFLARVAERAALHFGPGGALTDAAMQAAYAEVAIRVEVSLIAESARWGDYGGLDWTVDADWIPERDRILDTFLNGRAARVEAQLRAQGILPP
jgi:hypothetical protein